MPSASPDPPWSPALPPPERLSLQTMAALLHLYPAADWSPPRLMRRHGDACRERHDCDPRPHLRPRQPPALPDGERYERFRYVTGAAPTAGQSTRPTRFLMERTSHLLTAVVRTRGICGCGKVRALTPLTRLDLHHLRRFLQFDCSRAQKHGQALGGRLCSLLHWPTTLTALLVVAPAHPPALIPRSTAGGRWMKARSEAGWLEMRRSSRKRLAAAAARPQTSR